MKIISVRQPWAWMLVNGLKRIENRDWTTRYRGLLLIHAGKSFDADSIDWIWEKLTKEERKIFKTRKSDYQCGGIVGIVRFTDVLTESRDRWFVGEYGWYFEKAKPLEFLPLKGQLGLWTPHSDIVEVVKRECTDRQRDETLIV